MNNDIIKNEWMHVQRKAAMWDAQTTQSSWTDRMRSMAMQHETKIKLYFTILGAVAGFIAGPKVIAGALKLVDVGRKACDLAVRETL